MNKHMVYTCLSGVGGIIVIAAGAAICAFGVDKGSQDTIVHLNDTGIVQETTDGGLSLMALSGAVIIGFGSFVLIVSSVVFFEQRDQSIKDKINAEEKAKKKRGYKYKPKKKTPIEQVIHTFRHCIDECSKPIKLKEIEKKEAEAKDVITAQPAPSRKTSQSGSMTSVEKVLDNLPEFQTIDFLYREGEGEGELTMSQDEDLLLDKEERVSAADKDSFGSQTSFTKMNDLMAKEDEDENLSHTASYSDHDSVFTHEWLQNASDDERDCSVTSDHFDIGTSEDGKEEDGVKTERETAGDNVSTASQRGATEDKENKEEDDSASNDFTVKDGVIMVREKTADLPTSQCGLLTPGRLPPVHPRRLPLITDNVERLTCGIARTNAQAMDRARKPPPLPEILDSCP